MPNADVWIWSYLLAGLFAKKMGLPIKLTCAVNNNDIVARTIESGDFSAADNVVQTFASAMDIQVNMSYIYPNCAFGMS